MKYRFDSVRLLINNHLALHFAAIASTLSATSPSRCITTLVVGLVEDGTITNHLLRQGARPHLRRWD